MFCEYANHESINRYRFKFIQASRDKRTAMPPLLIHDDIQCVEFVLELAAMYKTKPTLMPTLEIACNFSAV